MLRTGGEGGNGCSPLSLFLWCFFFSLSLGRKLNQLLPLSFLPLFCRTTPPYPSCSFRGKREERSGDGIKVLKVLLSFLFFPRRQSANIRGKSRTKTTFRKGASEEKRVRPTRIQSKTRSIWRLPLSLSSHFSSSSCGENIPGTS